MSNPFDPIKPKVPLSAIAALLARQHGLKPPVSPIVRALMRAREANEQANALNPFLSPLARPTPPTTLSGQFDRNPPPFVGLLGSLADVGRPVPTPLQPNALAGYVGPTPRNIFYSFHYLDVFRVNHIRKGFKFRTGDKVRDRSLWETVRRTDETNLKRVINGGLNGTSVTCVLAGYETWSREWVRYEIARSLYCNKGLLTVFIDGCECPRGGFRPRGANPLDYIALGWDNRIYEQINGAWYLYDKIATKVPVWPKWLDKPGHGRCMPLSMNAPSYDWIDDDGGRNLIRWANRAAIAAGRSAPV